MRQRGSTGEMKPAGRRTRCEQAVEMLHRLIVGGQDEFDAHIVEGGLQTVFRQHAAVDTRAHHQNLWPAGEQRIQVLERQTVAVFAPPAVLDLAIGKNLNIRGVGASLDGYHAKFV